MTQFQSQGAIAPRFIGEGTVETVVQSISGEHEREVVGRFLAAAIRCRKTVSEHRDVL